MSEGPFLNIKAPKALLEPLDDYRFATRKPSRAEAACKLLDRALKAFFDISQLEPVRPGDPDYALVRARRRQPTEPFPIREIEARLGACRGKRTGISQRDADQNATTVDRARQG